MSKAAAVWFLLVSLNAASASPLTCDRFKEKLRSAIESGGNKVAMPYNFVRDPEDEDNQNFGGIVGLEGNVQCLKGIFFAFGANAHINASKDEDLQRGNRLMALAAAAICAVEALKPLACQSMARKIQHQALAEAAA